MAQTTTVIVGGDQLALATQTQVIGTVSLGSSISLISPVLDGFAAPGTLTTIQPALGAGLRMVVTTTRMLIVTRTGTITGTPAGKSVTNVSHDNQTPSLATPAAAQLSLANAGDNLTMTTAALTGTTAVLGSPELSAASIFEQVTAATGAGATLTYRIAQIGFVAAFP